MKIESSNLHSSSPSDNDPIPLIVHRKEKEKVWTSAEETENESKKEEKSRGPAEEGLKQTLKPQSMESDWREARIKRAKSFNDLFAALEEIGEIKDSHGKVYSAAKIIKRINLVRRGNLAIAFITRTYGLRETVANLRDQEKKKSASSPT